MQNFSQQPMLQYNPTHSNIDRAFFILPYAIVITHTMRCAIPKEHYEYTVLCND